MATITWLDKIDGLDLLNPQKNVNAADMNQIKTAVNTNDTSLSSHTGNTSNPHSVTKAQVGLSDVDNTTDAAKLAAALAKFVVGEVPSGTVNGINTVFILVNIPAANTLALYNVIRLKGGGVDYTLSSNSITFTTAPEVGSILQADYIKS